MKTFNQFIKENKENIYFDTFTSAVQHTESETIKRGYTIDEDDWFTYITAGTGKPRDGQTFKASIGLSKNGKPSKQMLHIQIYNRGIERNTYELNYYVR